MCSHVICLRGVGQILLSSEVNLLLIFRLVQVNFIQTISVGKYEPNVLVFCSKGELHLQLNDSGTRVLIEFLQFNMYQA